MTGQNLDGQAAALAAVELLRRCPARLRAKKKPPFKAVTRPRAHAHTRQESFVDKSLSEDVIGRHLPPLLALETAPTHTQGRKSL